MAQHEATDNSPVDVLSQHLGGVPGAGQLGVIVARPGVGKSALVVQLALDAMLKGRTALHASLRDSVDHVRSYYDELTGELARTGAIRDRANAMVTAERRRMIHSYKDIPFDPDHLERNLGVLRDVMHFEPDLLVVDGLETAEVGTLGALAGIARSLDAVAWATLRLPPDTEVPAEVWEHASVVLRLRPDGDTVRLFRVRADGAEELPVRVDPSTMAVTGIERGGRAAPSYSPRAGDCTLYSGGANGAEAAFGEIAEKWGVREVSFTFEGHQQARSRGRYELSSRELAAGDVSLVYVSRRLNRTYSQGTLIRKVLQTIWHMVSRSQQVFVIGAIQDDGTVKGGTGWSVELARMWEKQLWVFDQDQAAWSRWDGETWVKGTPTIESVHFCGTGTRYLTDAGRAAVDDLFRRSFGE